MNTVIASYVKWQMVSLIANQCQIPQNHTETGKFRGLAQNPTTHGKTDVSTNCFCHVSHSIYFTYLLFSVTVNALPSAQEVGMNYIQMELI